MKEWTFVSQVDGQGYELPASWPKLDPKWKVARPLKESEASPYAIDNTHRLVLTRAAQVTFTSADASGMLTISIAEAELGTFAKGTEHQAIARSGVLVRLASSR